MIRRLRDDTGGAASFRAADAFVSRGMADVLAALDDVIDDEEALARICAGTGTTVPCAAAGGGSGAAAASRRRLARRSAAAAVAALAACGVAVAALGVADAPTGGMAEPAVYTAYVVQRVNSALTAADPGVIAHMTVTTRIAAVPGGHAVTTTTQEWSYGDSWRAVTYSAAGHLLYEAGVSTTSVYTVVSYQARTWARQHGPGRPARLAPGRRGCEPVVAALPMLLQPALPAAGVTASSLAATVARDLHAAITCGTLVVRGRQRVDGMAAVELTSSPDSMIAETIWVSPDTYLPVRVAIFPAPGTPAIGQIANITWLRPTAQNLGKLTVPIPAGFRQVQLAEAIRSIPAHIRIWTRA
ncbi:MAG TPA: hypothetical protein VEL03_21555 [Streptosporangiaceae bacterium]|nr:hypothetical protein [Streptosporangiaceae bacterium]